MFTRVKYTTTPRKSWTRYPPRYHYSNGWAEFWSEPMKLLVDTLNHTHWLRMICIACCVVHPKLTHCDFHKGFWTFKLNTDWPSVWHEQTARFGVGKCYDDFPVPARLLLDFYWPPWSHFIWSTVSSGTHLPSASLLSWARRWTRLDLAKMLCLYCQNTNLNWANVGQFCFWCIRALRLKVNFQLSRTPPPPQWDEMHAV